MAGRPHLDRELRPGELRPGELRPGELKPRTWTVVPGRGWGGQFSEEMLSSAAAASCSRLSFAQVGRRTSNSCPTARASVVRPSVTSVSRQLRVRGEIMGPGKCESVGESQSVLVMIKPIISPRTRNLAPTPWWPTPRGACREGGDRSTTGELRPGELSAHLCVWRQPDLDERPLRATAALLRRRAWHMASTAHHYGSLLFGSPPPPGP
jgi:hypothetical protein